MTDMTNVWFADRDPFSPKVKQEMRRKNKEYLERKRIVRKYYMEHEGVEKSMEVLNWGYEKVSNEYFRLMGML